MCIVGKSEKERTIFPNGTIDKPHGGNKANSTQHTDRWKIPDSVHTIILQDSEGCGVGEGDGRHEECNTERI